MTVKELILGLSKFDENFTIVTRTGKYYLADKVTTVEDGWFDEENMIFYIESSFKDINIKNAVLIE